MRAKTPILTLLLTLTILTVLPSSTPNARAVAQVGQTSWSPFGPQEKKLTITDFGDFTTMFNAFLNGQIDITDAPIGNAAISSMCANQNFFCTSPTSELAIFQLDINHRIPFLGISLQENRTAPPPSFVLPVTTSSGCSAGFGQLTVDLQNQEQNNAVILDSLNMLTISNQPSGVPSVTVGDSGGANPTGTYVFPCILAGDYAISSSIYDSTSPCSSTTPTICVTIGSGQSVRAPLRVDWNSPSTKQPSQAGIYTGRALAHLLDKPNFVQGLFGTSATFDDEQVAPSQNVPNLFSNTAECSDHPWFSPCNPVSAYNLVNDNIGGGAEWWTLPGQAAGVGPGYSGVADLRAACDDFVKAGFTVVGGANSTDCGAVALASQGTVALSSYPHLNNNGQHVFNAWRTSVGRKQFGIILGDTINFLFGTPNSGCTVLYWGAYCDPRAPQSIQNVICVFDQTCQWNIYQGGFSLGQVPQQLYDFYHSSFGSSFCGGPPTTSLPNYPVYCDPALDTYATAGEFSHTLPQSIQFFAQAAATGTSNGMTVPVFTRINQFLALDGWNFQQCGGTPPPCFPSVSSLVNTLGGGFGAGYGYWSLLNMRQVPGYTPPTPGFSPGGGDPDLIRRGFSQDTFNLSPFQAATAWETEIVSLIYDSMLQANPLTGGTDGQIVDWQTISHYSTFNPTEVSCNAFNGCIRGTTTSVWRLRNDLKFQDGTPLTADDVVYTVLAFRDVPSYSYGYLVGSVSSAVALDPHTVQIKLQGQNAFAVADLGSVPIIPRYIWEPICGPVVNGAIPGGSTSLCADPTFDPMAQSIMVGSGPWQCVVPAGFPNAGHVGGSCTVTHPPNCAQGQLSCLSGQALSPGDQIFLTRNNNFDRCCPGDASSSLYKLSWADVNNDGVVNILDLASAAVKFGQPDPYWVNPNIAPGTTVNIQDLATVAFYFGHGTTYPFRPSQLTGLDPQIDPFFCSNSGC